MISVDYDLIDRWLKENGLTRNKLCQATGISANTMTASVRRRSKMHVANVWRIADFMGIDPTDLLVRDENGNYDQSEYDSVQFGRARYEEGVENDAINYVVSIMKDLNADGIQEAGRLVSLLREVPSLRKTPKL